MALAFLHSTHPQISLFALGIIAAVMLAHVARNITSRLRHQENIQASILDALPANIALIDKQGVIQATNGRWNNSPQTSKFKMTFSS
ncbi:MAG: hypothetical protein Q8N96_14025 [Methylovulum sp.]|nr:hypothetical protein [Methylovulum sp.]